MIKKISMRQYVWYLFLLHQALKYKTVHYLSLLYIENNIFILLLQNFMIILHAVLATIWYLIVLEALLVCQSQTYPTNSSILDASILTFSFNIGWFAMKNLVCSKLVAVVLLRIWYTPRKGSFKSSQKL